MIQPYLKTTLIKERQKNQCERKLNECILFERSEFIHSERISLIFSCFIVVLIFWFFGIKPKEQRKLEINGFTTSILVALVFIVTKQNY